MMTDPIADMLTRIRNASMAGLEKVDMPASKIKIEITHFANKSIRSRRAFDA